SATCARCPKGAPPSPCSSITTIRYRRRSPPRSRRNSPDLTPAQARGRTESPNGQTEVSTNEAALQRGNDRSRRPWQDHADRGADTGVGGEGLDLDVRDL